MRTLSDLMKIFRRDYSDVVGVDIGSSSTKVVRLKRVNGHAAVMGVDVLPAITLGGEGASLEPVQLSKALKARYVALATSRPGAMVKLLTFPAHSEKPVEAHVHELMGLDGNADCRVGYEIVQENRSEIRVLAVAMPDVLATSLFRLFPDRIPAPCSVEMSGMACMTAYSHGPGAQHREECAAVIDFGEATTMVSFFNKGLLVLVRKFDFGALNVLKKLQDILGVDQDVALGILNVGSFDVSRIIHQAMEPFLQQLTISWDFVERRENVHVSHLYACGGGVSLRLWAQEVESAAGLKPVVWNPFEGLDLLPGAFPETLKGQESRFAAALGAALGMLRVH